MTARFNNGVLELCALSMFIQDEQNVCAADTSISAGTDASADSIYPILRRLKKEEYVSSYTEKVSGGYERKNYIITDKGQRLLDRLISDHFGGDFRFLES